MASTVPYPHPTNSLIYIDSEVEMDWSPPESIQQIETHDCVKKILVYLNFSEPFDIHTDASLYQLETCIS